jgi:hypothetical protein
MLELQRPSWKLLADEGSWEAPARVEIALVEAGSNAFRC